jgi:HAD superfamily hydrolase (TIGR01549 family)
MNSNKVISFDLQGTISNSNFSDYFWLTLLPELYAAKNKLSLEEGRNELVDFFNQIGKYDYRYYDHRYWLKALELDWSFNQAVKAIKLSPSFYPGMGKLIKKLYKKVPLIILSTTTREFIDIELNKYSNYFNHIFSTIDDLAISGKPPGAFEKVATGLSKDNRDFFHIGDSLEMDIENANKAGWETFHYTNKVTINQLKEAINHFLEEY